MSVYAFSDLHGRYDLWEKIKEKIQPDDIVYNLGDNIDRGPDGIKICQDLMTMKNVKCIRGNHEMMAIEAIPCLLANNFNTIPVQNWFWNGGLKTWDQLEEIGYDDDDQAFKEKCWKIINFFKNDMRDFYHHSFYTNTNSHIVILSHAGFTPGREYESEIGWARGHFLDKWPQNTAFDISDNLWMSNKIILVHGHTPIQYLQRDLKLNLDTPEVIRYCDGHKIDIDLGAVVSNRVALLNLETFEVTYIE